MSASRVPFILISWNENFIERLLGVALEENDGSLEKCVFVFPHARPARYLERLIQLKPKIRKPCLMPRMLPVQALFEALHKETTETAYQASMLDQTALLLDCVRAEQAENPGPINDLPTDNIQAFFPWGVRLANLFEDCFNSRVAPANFLYLEDELAPFAALLLGRLSNLHKRYVKALGERGWNTRALRSFNLAERLEKSPEPFSTPLLRASSIYLAGFYRPNACEETLFKYLWIRHGARIVMHGDERLTGGYGPEGAAHWSCKVLENWRASWNASWDAAEKLTRPPQPGAAKETKINFFSGYDLHSQLAALQNLMQNVQAASDSQKETAVILPDTRLLLPVLHHMHPKDINISMGYPLERSPLNMLLETVLSLQEKKRLGGYYWKDCIRLIRHPYVKMLIGDKERGAWLGCLQSLENKLRQGRRFVDFPAMFADAALESAAEGGTPLPEESLLADMRKLCAVLSETLLLDWEQTDTLRSLSAALSSLCELLLEKGERLWPRFPIDAECLYRFMNIIQPELTQNLMRDEKLPAPVLFSILRELIKAQRVPFDAYPLTATQIMGLLESRLLSFKRVFILEATDDLLPGGLQNDPLFPDNLRREIGLPYSQQRQENMAYYFFRLLQGAEEVNILWEEGVESKGIFDSKKLKSRFVEELIWQEEQKENRLLKAEARTPGAQTLQPNRRLPGFPDSCISDGPLHLLTCRPGSGQVSGRTVKPGQALVPVIDALFTKPLSASRLSDYLKCPLAFYYRHLIRLNPVAEVGEDDDPRETGALLHLALRDFHAKRLGKKLKKEDKIKTELGDIFERLLLQSEIAEAFPADALITLRKSGPWHLRKYLDQQPENSRTMALEADAEAAVAGMDGKPVLLHGRLDRIDLREFDGGEGEYLQVLDYKTGKVKPLDAAFWFGGDWEKLLKAESLSKDEAEALFISLADELEGNIQLPFYLYLLRHGTLRAPGPDESGVIHPNLQTRGMALNAGWVALKEGGKEISLFPADLGEDDLAHILDRQIPALFRFILRCLRDDALMNPRSGEHCSYCDYAQLCRVGL